ncbi:GSK3-beta interaction protein [Ditylenchus destructor]|uniref:GSK3-beta interaction protein n=1 Tax=Ditylenchus destructor TaxID=166010 RepID=A0AAD4NE10_9BILA|nr:GSK3-beta interaction protein [Ditylenchus destructor]
MSSSEHSSAQRSRSPTPLRMLNGCDACRNPACSQLETEAIAAVREMAPFVTSICISEVLARTPDLIFLNVVTLEGNCFCVELTQRGWRICSDRMDCMYGDFRKLELHAKYFETIYALMGGISTEFREKFAANLSERLAQHVSSEEVQ